MSALIVFGVLVLIAGAVGIVLYYVLPSDVSGERQTRRAIAQDYAARHVTGCPVGYQDTGSAVIVAPWARQRPGISSLERTLMERASMGDRAAQAILEAEAAHDAYQAAFPDYVTGHQSHRKEC